MLTINCRATLTKLAFLVSYKWNENLHFLNEDKVSEKLLTFATLALLPSNGNVYKRIFGVLKKNNNLHVYFDEIF